MNTGGESAELLMKMMLNGSEVLIRLTGSGAKNVAVLLYSVLREQNKTKGSERLSNMLRSGKKLRVYTFQDKDLQKFKEVAKQYGILYKKMLANNLQMQKKLTCQLQKDQAQLTTLQGEIAKALIGESLYQPDDLSIAIKTLRSKIEDAEKQLQVLKNEEIEKKTINEGIVPAYHQFKTWAEEFDNATLEVKKMIANQLFSRVEVGKGYRLHLELNITYQQFCEEWISLPSFQTASA